LTLPPDGRGSVGSVLTLPLGLFGASPADGGGGNSFLTLTTRFSHASGRLELCGTSTAAPHGAVGDEIAVERDAPTGLHPVDAVVEDWDVSTK
jgi:hypothetical protein